MDHLKIPFNITNQIEHPTRQNYLVYHFKDKIKAAAFEEGLKSANLFYESDVQDEDKNSVRYLFGVRKSDVDAVDKINYTVLGQGRTPFIKDKSARWFIIGFGVLMIVLALLGAIFSR